jgi:hypothetical protein
MARQDQMEANVIQSWKRDPLVVRQPQIPRKGTPEVHAKELVN